MTIGPAVSTAAVSRIGGIKANTSRGPRDVLLLDVLLLEEEKNENPLTIYLRKV